MRRLDRRWWIVLVALSIVSPAAAAEHAAAMAAEPTDLDRWVAQLAGGWAGFDNVTPMGSMPFALLFEWQDDGSLHAHSALNRETYIDLRFEKDAEGRWRLHEAAGMEGAGEHRYTLAPAATEGDIRRWTYPQDPDFLAIDMRVDADTLHMDVQLHGEEHVRFALDRLPEEEIPELRRELTEARAQSPREGTSIRDLIAGGDEPIAIRTARRHAEERPDDARARLELARALGAAIEENPATNGPRFAFEMLASLRTALDLDPTLPETYHHLVGYYLNAPPIAGGSLDKAEETARQLAAIDAEAAADLLAQIEARRTP